MKKNIFIALGIFILVLGLAIINSRRFQSWQENSKGEKLFSLESLGLEGLEEITGINEPGIKKFISPNGKLEIEYPDDWVAVEEKEILKSLLPEDWTLKYNLETLFLAAKIRGEKFIQLIVYKGTFDMAIPDIVDEMQKANQDKGWQIELIFSDFQEKEGIFDAKYLDPAGNIIRSREKILTSERGEVYFLSGIALEKDWQEAIQEIDKILNSAIIIKN